MRTSKPISAISYNTPGYLRVKLEELRKNKRISEWYYIRHEPEDDEAGNKKHIHLYVVPSKMLQTDDLIAEFYEYDLTHPDKPLTCPHWRVSKFPDWYLYGIHDKTYLVSKGQTRRYHYRMEDVQAYNTDALLQSVREIDLTSLTAVKAMLDAQENGLTFAQFFRSGAVPIQQFLQFKNAWELMISDHTERSGRETHTPRVNEATGEVLEPPEGFAGLTEPSEPFSNSDRSDPDQPTEQPQPELQNS